MLVCKKVEYEYRAGCDNLRQEIMQPCAKQESDDRRVQQGTDRGHCQESGQGECVSPFRLEHECS